MTPKAQSVSQRLSLLLTLCVFFLAGCAPDPSVAKSQALQAAAAWFDQAQASLENDGAAPPSCHAFGLLKFNDASCSDMIEHAARLDASTRQIDSVELMKCFGQGSKEVCGEFAEIWFNSQTMDGVSVKEGMVLKRDNDEFRLYWYRSDTLFTELTDRAERREAGTKSAQMAAKQEQLDAVYTQMVERDPSVYAYPPCIDARASRSAMIGELIAQRNVTGLELDRRAEQCAKDLCLTLVGKRIAALCI